ncbi:MAG TPA: hypothetical protein VGN55_11120 [Xanthobacteraceae bacterium]|jgi:hypothetical protein
MPDRPPARDPIETETTGPDWGLALSHTIAPLRGEPLATLSDARAYILALAPGVQHQPDWQRAADLLIVAAKSKHGLDLEQATFALERALFFHRLLPPRS